MNRTLYVVFTDGAASGNPGPGGWGAILVSPDGHVRELGGGERRTTNNRMELMAAIAALGVLREYQGEVRVYTDSKYLIQGITGWVWGWQKNGWKTASGSDVLNRELWEQLFDLAQGRKKNGGISWDYVPGHAGVEGNERADEIAVGYSKGQPPYLYNGPLQEYGRDILNLVPKIDPGAAKAGGRSGKSSSRKKKGAAHSYLSWIGSEVVRHSSWDSCRQRVEGSSGARYKKAMSADEESAILKEWGVDPSRVRNAK